jgi:hypothetical protein
VDYLTPPRPHRLIRANVTGDDKVTLSKNFDRHTESNLAV